MFLVKLEIIQEDLKVLTIVGKCDYLPVNNHEFSVRVFSKVTGVEKVIDFGKVIEQREDQRVITFRTTEGVYELSVLEILPTKKKVNPPNVYDFIAFKNSRKLEKKKPSNYETALKKKHAIRNIFNALGINKNKSKVLSFFTEEKNIRREK